MRDLSRFKRRMLHLKIVNVAFVEERHMRPSGRITIIQIQQYTVPDEKSVRLSSITSASYLDISGSSSRHGRRRPKH